MWQKLIETLDKLGEVYDNLATLGEKKRTALVAVDMKLLSDILDVEQLMAAKIQKLEQKRLELLKNLSETMARLRIFIKKPLRPPWKKI